MASIRKILMHLAADTSSDLKLHKKAFIAAGSIAAGFLGLMLLPVAALSSICNIEAPSFRDIEADREAVISQLSPEQHEKMSNSEADGQAIAEAMKKRGLQEQTIKAQLIYMSFFDDNRLTDFEEYAGFFVNDNEQLIPALNEKYSIAVGYDEFMRTYVLVMNSTINQYMFSNAGTKNAADLAAWCRNAYISQWRYAENTFGERTGDERIRCADNVGLIMGYIRYDTKIKTFTDDTVNLAYTVKGGIETLPDIPGVGVYNEKEFGVYIGGGQVIFSSAIGGIQRQPVSAGYWTSWCTFDAVTYPQDMNEPTTETTTGA